jgi:hypothetical protein
MMETNFEFSFEDKNVDKFIEKFKTDKFICELNSHLEFFEKKDKYKFYFFILNSENLTIFNLLYSFYEKIIIRQKIIDFSDNHINIKNKFIFSENFFIKKFKLNQKINITNNIFTTIYTYSYDETTLNIYKILINNILIFYTNWFENKIKTYF